MKDLKLKVLEEKACKLEEEFYLNNRQNTPTSLSGG